MLSEYKQQTKSSSVVGKPDISVKEKTPRNTRDRYIQHSDLISTAYSFGEIERDIQTVISDPAEGNSEQTNYH